VNHPLFISSDHGGFELKSYLLKNLNLEKFSTASSKREWIDLGPNSAESVDYPKFAKLLCERVVSTFSSDDLLRPCGILICGSGVGVSISANRHSKIRAALCWSEEVAALSRAHNASNVLCLSERLLDNELNLKIVKAWLGAEFEGGRHARRIELIDSEIK
jgi:ribose 5-phosphate isomerase B